MKNLSQMMQDQSNKVSLRGGQDSAFKSSASYNTLIQTALQAQDQQTTDSDYDEDGDALMKSADLANNSSAVIPDHTFELIIGDDDFLAELRSQNENLIKYLNKERLSLLVDYLIKEPTFNDSPERCFKLPFQSCQAFCIDVPLIRDSLFQDPNPLMEKIFSFITQAPKEDHLNVTLGGYFNKIISYWLIKLPDQMLGYIIKQKNIVSQIFEHLYLTSCISDLLVRICSVKNIDNLPRESYKNLRYEIIQNCINTLEHHRDDDFITEQLFDILSGIVRKCYQMYNPREFFDQILSPFVLQPILDFTFSGGQRSKQGSDFLKTFFYNMFIAQPHDAIQDVMEINFGFEITSIAGQEVKHEESKEEKTSPLVDSTELQHEKDIGMEPNESEIDVQAKKPAESEFKAMKQEEILKEKLLQGAQMIYSCQDINNLLASQIILFLTKFENELKQNQLGVMEKVKLFEMLETIIKLDNDTINKGICEKTFTEYLMNEYEKNECNSNMLQVLNKTFLAFIKQKSCYQLKQKLFKETQLVFRLCKRMCVSEANIAQSSRKDIYTYIIQLADKINQIMQDDEQISSLLQEQKEVWDALLQYINKEKSEQTKDWGTREVPEVDNSNRTEDKVTKHDEKSSLSLTDKGQASTTKKIKKDAITRRQALLEHDDVVSKA